MKTFIDVTKILLGAFLYVIVLYALAFITW